jgi:3-oxoacyl-[acyl-carrier-protein] synthase-3
MTTYAHIVGWGKYVPEQIITNDDIAQFMDTSDGWIKTRTGISERRFAAEDETTATMAIEAAKLALDRARITPAAVDLIIVATVSPEHIFPSTACIVQDAIGSPHAGAYDLSAACSGFIYGMSMATAMIQTGAIKVALIIGSETLSRLLDEQDRSTYPLFGDGAGAIVLQANETPGGVLASVLGSDGSGAEYLSIPAGGSKCPVSQEVIDNRLHYIQMNGREVYRFATRVMGRAAKQACVKAGIDLGEIDLFIPHQANIRIIESARKYLNISDEKVFTNLDKYGNTSTASIPIALCEAIEQGRVQATDKLVMVGFGAGLTWAASVVQWGVPMPYKRRKWWYRALRWTVYRWARIRSAVIRFWRHIENLVPLKNGNGALPQTEEQEKKIDDARSTNGSRPQPTVTDVPTELPLTQPDETEEQPLLEAEQPFDGK